MTSSARPDWITSLLRHSICLLAVTSEPETPSWHSRRCSSSKHWIPSNRMFRSASLRRTPGSITPLPSVGLPWQCCKSLVHRAHTCLWSRAGAGWQHGGCRFARSDCGKSCERRCPGSAAEAGSLNQNRSGAGGDPISKPCNACSVPMILNAPVRSGLNLEAEYRNGPSTTGRYRYISYVI